MNKIYRLWCFIGIILCCYAVTVYLPSVHIKQTPSQQKQKEQQHTHKEIHLPAGPPSSPLSNNSSPPTKGFPRSQLLDENRTIKADVQFMLDFAVIGHGKCGTTTFGRWLDSHPQVRMPPREVLSMSLGDSPGALVSSLYRKMWKQNEDTGDDLLSREASMPIRRGYKSPAEIRSPHSVRWLDQYFPKSTLIVGIRHPLSYFKSLHNFKIQNMSPRHKTSKFGHPNDMIDHCLSYHSVACIGTAKAWFHVHLAMFGKTANTQELEKRYPILNGNITMQTSNPLFLFDLQQLSMVPDEIDDPEFDHQTGTNATTRVAVMRKDVERLLDLKEGGMSPEPPRIKPGAAMTEEQQKQRDTIKIQDMCIDEYIPIRNELVRLAREISIWIRTSGFLDHPTVHVSSRSYFEHRLATAWMKDPCDDRKSN